MPLHFNDLDLIEELTGVNSALIVPCQMCPAVTVAVREGKPFIQLFENFLKSGPFEHYVNDLKSRLQKRGVNTEVFWSFAPHHWFLCMWTSRQCNKLMKRAKQYGTIIVLGCDSASETVRGLVNSNECKVIEAMEVAGIMNAKLKFQFPFEIHFDECKVVPLSQKDQT